MISVELEPIWQEEMQQQIFRALLSCNSLPGTIMDLSRMLNQQSALLGILATLLDRTVTLHDRDELISQRDRRMLAAVEAPIDEARFIVANGAIAPEPEFEPNLGTLTRPEFGATVMLRGHHLGQGLLTLKLTGPGIPGQRTVSLAGFERDWFRCRAAWIAPFPMGVDFILLDESKMMLLPRTTQVEISS